MRSNPPAVCVVTPVKRDCSGTEMAESWDGGLQVRDVLGHCFFGGFARFEVGTRPWTARREQQQRGLPDRILSRGVMGAMVSGRGPTRDSGASQVSKRQDQQRPLAGSAQPERAILLRPTSATKSLVASQPTVSS